MVQIKLGTSYENAPVTLKLSPPTPNALLLGNRPDYVSSIKQTYLKQLPGPSTVIQPDDDLTAKLSELATVGMQRLTFYQNNHTANFANYNENYPSHPLDPLGLFIASSSALAYAPQPLIYLDFLLENACAIGAYVILALDELHNTDALWDRLTRFSSVITLNQVALHQVSPVRLPAIKLQDADDLVEFTEGQLPIAFKTSPEGRKR